MQEYCINYIPEKRSFRGYYVFDSNAAAAPPPPPPPSAAAASSHHFVVSAITFEGFKLRSSNLTHTLFIQISRTSSITDIVVQSKMAAGGHFVKKLKKKNCVSSKWQRLIKVFSDIQNLSPLFTTFHHFFSHFSPFFPNFHHFSPLFPTFPHY